MNTLEDPVGCLFKPGDVVYHKASEVRMVVMDVEDRQTGWRIFRPPPSRRWLVSCRFFHERREPASGLRMVYETDSFWDFELILSPESHERELAARRNAVRS